MHVMNTRLYALFSPAPKPPPKGAADTAGAGAPKPPNPATGGLSTNFDKHIQKCIFIYDIRI
jgi:hypothetical protein